MFAVPAGTIVTLSQAPHEHAIINLYKMDPKGQNTLFWWGLDLLFHRTTCWAARSLVKHSAMGSWLLKPFQVRSRGAPFRPTYCIQTDPPVIPTRQGKKANCSLISSREWHTGVRLSSHRQVFHPVVSFISTSHPRLPPALLGCWSPCSGLRCSVRWSSSPLVATGGPRPSCCWRCSWSRFREGRRCDVSRASNLTNDKITVILIGCDKHSIHSMDIG